MINRHTKFEVYMITHNEDMKGNTKGKKILVLSHPLADLGVTHKVYLWLDGKGIVHFLLAIIKHFSLALTPVALLSEISRNHRRFSDGASHILSQILR